jgi:hypothetical protein
MGYSLVPTDYSDGDAYPGRAFARGERVARTLVGELDRGDPDRLGGTV